MNEVRIHRYAAGPQGALVNAYLVETATGVIAVDGTLTVSDGRAMGAQLASLGKPLLGVLVTHAHPDHYGGIGELIGDHQVPVFATSGTAAAIRRDDPAKEEILRPMFGDEWPRRRRFPDTLVHDGETVVLDGAEFHVIDLGAGESPHDSVWLLGDDRRTVFPGDVVYDQKHAYLADGFHQAWLANMARLERELPGDAVLYIGHGGPASVAHFSWQREYIERFLAAIRGADWSEPGSARAGVVAEMKRFLPSDELSFLMELSIDPVAAQLAMSATT